MSVDKRPVPSGEPSGSQSRRSWVGVLAGIIYL